MNPKKELLWSPWVYLKCGPQVFPKGPLLFLLGAPAVPRRALAVFSAGGRSTRLWWRVLAGGLPVFLYPEIGAAILESVVP